MRRQPAVVYTTLARMLAPPDGGLPAAAAIAAVAAAEAMTAALCGTATTLREIWCAACLLHFLRRQPQPLAVLAAW